MSSFNLFVEISDARWSSPRTPPIEYHPSVSSSQCLGAALGEVDDVEVEDDEEEEDDEEDDVGCEEDVDSI